MYPALLPDEAVRLSQGGAKGETEGCVAICNCLAPYLVTNVIRGSGEGVHLQLQFASRISVISRAFIFALCPLFSP